MVKRLGHGVYEVDGYVIDVLNTSAEEHEKKAENMVRDEFVRYAVAVAVANYYGDKDGLWSDENVVSSVDLSIAELRKIYYRSACKIYDGKQEILHGDGGFDWLHDRF